MLIGLQTFACTSPLILQARDLGVEERKKTDLLQVVRQISDMIHVKRRSAGATPCLVHANWLATSRLPCWWPMM